MYPVNSNLIYNVILFDFFPIFDLSITNLLCFPAVSDSYEPYLHISEHIT